MKRCMTILAILLLSAALGAITDEEIEAAYHRSYDYEQVENFEDAIRALLPVLEAYPRAYTINLRLGWLYYRNGKYANSIRHYDTAIQAAAASLEAKLGRLLPLLAQERYAEVEKAAFDILNVDYYNYFGNLRLCYALRMQEKFDVAEKVSLKMLTVYPVDIAFLTEYALTKVGQGDMAAALRVFANIRILDPENPTAKQYLGL